MSAPHNPWAQLAGIEKPQLSPADMTREERVKLCAEVFSALVDDRKPSREAALFVGGGGMAWLELGGNLTKDYWRTCGKQGSNFTEAVLYRRMIESSASRSTTRKEPALRVGTSSITNSKGKK